MDKILLGQVSPSNKYDKPIMSRTKASICHGIENSTQLCSIYGCPLKANERSKFSEPISVVPPRHRFPLHQKRLQDHDGTAECVRDRGRLCRDSLHSRLCRQGHITDPRHGCVALAEPAMFAEQALSLRVYWAGLSAPRADFGERRWFRVRVFDRTRVGELRSPVLLCLMLELFNRPVLMRSAGYLPLDPCPLR